MTFSEAMDFFHQQKYECIHRQDCNKTCPCSELSVEWETINKELIPKYKKMLEAFKKERIYIEATEHAIRFTPTVPCRCRECDSYNLLFTEEAASNGGTRIHVWCKDCHANNWDTPKMERTPKAQKVWTTEETLRFIEKLENRTPEELREYMPQSKLRYWGTQQALYDYCDRYQLVEGNSYLYVLKCSHDLYYIGETRAIFQRFRRHFTPGRKTGTSATMVYEPESVCEIIPLGKMNKSQRLCYEDALTIEYANKYAIQKVRGGHFSHYDVEKAYSAEKLKSHWIYEENGTLQFINPRNNWMLSTIKRLQKFPRIHPTI